MCFMFGLILRVLLVWRNQVLKVGAEFVHHVINLSEWYARRPPREGLGHAALVVRIIGVGKAAGHQAAHEPAPVERTAIGILVGHHWADQRMSEALQERPGALPIVPGILVQD